MCAIHAGKALLDLTVLCRSFEVLELPKCKNGAKVYVLSHTLHSALHSKALHFANRLGFWPKRLLDEQSIASMLSDGDYTYSALSAVKSLKWKTREQQAVWKWRLLITHSLHPLRRTSRTVGRCVSVLLICM